MYRRVSVILLICVVVAASVWLLGGGVNPDHSEEAPSLQTQRSQRVLVPEGRQDASALKSVRPEVPETSMGHTVREVTAGRVVLLLDKAVTPEDLSGVEAALEVRIEKSRSGRTGAEVHFAPGVPLHAAQLALQSQGLQTSGQLQRFHFQSAHKHANCGTCLMQNFQALAEHPSVKTVSSFLGDSEASRIDVVVSDPSAPELMEILRNDHFPQL